MLSVKNTHSSTVSHIYGAKAKLRVLSLFLCKLVNLNLKYGKSSISLFLLTFDDPLRGGYLGFGGGIVVRRAVVNRHFDFSSDLG